VNLDTKGGHVLLLEFTSQVALDEGGLYSAVVVSTVGRQTEAVKALSHACLKEQRKEGGGA
jgi:hypothetical protein